MSSNRVSRRSVLKIFSATSVALSLTTLTGYIYAFEIEPHWLAYERLQIPIKSLPEEFYGFKLVCLSDFHHEPGDGIDYLQRVVQHANRLEPDIICLLGDYVFSDAQSISALTGVLSKLRASEGVYAVLGNHDYWTDPELIRESLKKAGIYNLVNQGLLVQRADQAIYLAGLDDGWSGEPDLQAALEGAPEDAPVIVLMHEPDFADEVSKSGRVDLQLSGHSHGGQIKPLFVEAPIRPEFARKYTAGHYEIGQMHLYVTRGVGTIPPRARFNCRPEITEIVLIPAGS
jgi:predicted MPP superfamily phosphohydrolase